MILTQAEILETIKDTLLEVVMKPDISEVKISKLILLKTKKQLKQLNPSKPTRL